MIDQQGSLLNELDNCKSSSLLQRTSSAPKSDYPDTLQRSKVVLKRDGIRRIRSSKIQQNMTEMLAQSKLKKVQSNLKVVVEMGSSEEQTDTF